MRCDLQVQSPFMFHLENTLFCLIDHALEAQQKEEEEKSLLS